MCACGYSLCKCFRPPYGPNCFGLMAVEGSKVSVPVQPNKRAKCRLYKHYGFFDTIPLLFHGLIPSCRFPIEKGSRTFRAVNCKCQQNPIAMYALKPLEVRLISRCAERRFRENNSPRPQKSGPAAGEDAQYKTRSHFAGETAFVCEFPQVLADVLGARDCPTVRAFVS